MRILQWNLENFFITNSHKIKSLKQLKNHIKSSPSGENKDIKKLHAIAEMILTQSPDVAVLCEVGGKGCLNLFNRLFLNNQYMVFMRPSNSLRNIDIGFLVKRSIAKDFEIMIKSNRTLKLPARHTKSIKFSRDIPELHLRNKHKHLIFMGVHLKSRASIGEDYFGIETRFAEVNGLIKLYSKNKNKYPNSKIFVAGDFNGFLQKENCEFEFEDLLSLTPLKDYHDLVEKKNRVSYVRVDPYQESQIDYILIEEDLKPQVLPSSGFLNYKTFYDLPLPYPASLKEKRLLPSDHYPQILDIEV